MDKLNGAIYTIWYIMDKEELGSGYIYLGKYHWYLWYYTLQICW